MKFYFHQVWKEDGREYANRLDFTNVGEARHAHKAAADFMWAKNTYTHEAVTDLIWEDDQRQAPIQQGTTRKFPLDVTAEPKQTRVPDDVKRQLAAMIGRPNV